MLHRATAGLPVVHSKSLKKSAWPGLPQAPKMPGCGCQRASTHLEQCLHVDGGPSPFISLITLTTDTQAARFVVFSFSRFLDAIFPHACLRSSFPYLVLPVLVRRAFQVFLCLLFSSLRLYNSYLPPTEYLPLPTYLPWRTPAALLPPTSPAHSPGLRTESKPPEAASTRTSTLGFQEPTPSRHTTTASNPSLPNATLGCVPPPTTYHTTAGIRELIRCIPMVLGPGSHS